MTPGEEDGFRARVRAELDRVVVPHAEAWERRGRVSRTGWRELGAAGLLALPHDGPGFLRSAVFLEELGATGYAGVRASIGVHAYMASSYLRLFGSAGQRAALLPGAERGDDVLALAISEDGAGTDLRCLATTAVPDGAGGYRLSGHKSAVANASAAAHFVVLARTGPGPGLSGASLLLVDASAAGVTHRRQDALGWRAADVRRVEFDDVAVGGDRLLGKPNRALVHLMRALDFERLVAGLLAVGGVRHCLRLLTGFARTHRVGDAPLSANQVVRHRIADLDAQWELVAAYARRTAERHSRGELDTKSASVLKLTATELAVTAAQLCVQYHGARGYLDGSTAARLYRDSIAGTIAAGASELLRELVFESN
ncbi:acyl-CoA dehydrogenase family protein [Saccharothrix longispora]|uniref:Alkylation response protein AidB-like acyl-CoA dehydrogenase n=1 Tax=Saccharothrix longispora TaxID=33920 RepID=A0ABU1PV42_9PSEU|nr:acyl-CoA dehydrogenase family protein [Saccharothrix longispora]MDR6594009.1 alkylation response protein AidB-like acyl-CoA dehydrogenase [Saccharothrix longispora]